MLQGENGSESDAWEKVNNKDYYNKRNNTGVNELDPGNIVLLKKNKKDKLTSEFEITKYQVINRTGNTVTIKDLTGNTSNRNVSMVKGFISPKNTTSE